MFLVPPRVSFLPTGSARNDLLGFGDPLKLKEGVVLTEKHTRKGKVIYSLYDLEMKVKYVTEQSVTVERISDNKIIVKKRVTNPTTDVSSNNNNSTTTEHDNDDNALTIPDFIKNGKMIKSITNPVEIGYSSSATGGSFIPRSNPIKIPENQLGSIKTKQASARLPLTSAESETESITATSESSLTDSKGGSPRSFEESSSLKTSQFENIITPKSYSDSAYQIYQHHKNSSVQSTTINNHSSSSSANSYIKANSVDSQNQPDHNNNNASNQTDQPRDSMTIIVEIQSPHIPGEKIEQAAEDVLLIKANGKSIPGTLYLSNYQIIFLPYHEVDKSAANMFKHKSTLTQECDFVRTEVSLPLATIAKFEKLDRQNSSGLFMFGGENLYSVEIYAKDFRRPIRFALDPSKHSRRDICNYLTRYIFPQSVHDVFALSSLQRDEEWKIPLGWKLYDPHEEFTRLGVNGSQWKFMDYNEKYQLCETYPRSLVIPEKSNEALLREVATFRSKGRIPVLTWRHPLTGVSLTRCSQPKTGMSRSFRCKADEKLIKWIQGTNQHSRKLHIMDARPMANAFANMALGGGYENLNYYPDCELEFMGVANIHVVRDSWNKLRDLCDQSSQYCMLENNDPNRMTSMQNSVSWLSQLEATRWLDHLSSIIAGSVRVVQLMDQKRESVLVHCSDGWDRTSQLCSLAQLLIDKYYRTIKGFCILIDKTWLQFGHKFGERFGLNFEDMAYKDVERSPIFFQFIDATWQIMQQFPYSFEFTEDLLIDILEHAFSGRFGTFLMNSQKEREEARLMENSRSMWAFVMCNSAQYANPFYSDREPHVLYPNVDVKSMQLWKTYYFRYLVDHDTLEQYKNQYTILGREMRATIQQQEAEKKKLAHDYEDLKKQFEELQKAQQQLIQQHQQQQQQQQQQNGGASNHHHHLLSGSSALLDPSAIHRATNHANGSNNGNHHDGQSSLLDYSSHRSDQNGNGAGNQMVTINGGSLLWYDDWVDVRDNHIADSKRLPNVISTDSSPSPSISST